jgi:hypothetical protein
MKREKRKPQDDRLLKRLSMIDRRQQERLRQLIQADPLFKVI